MIGRWVMYGIAEIAPQHAAGVMRELVDQGLVEAKLFPKPRNRLGIGPLTDHFLHRITRSDVEQQEHDDQDSEQSRDREREPPDDEREHATC